MKGENWDHSAGFRHAIGQRVLKFAPTLPHESCCYNPLSEIRWETDYEIADAQTIANAVIRHGDDDSLYKHFEDAAVDLVSAGIIHLGYVFRNLDAPREPTLPDVLAHYSQPGMDFTDVLIEMQKTVHMPGGKSAPRLQWFDVNGKPTFTHPYVSKAVQRQLNRADREASSIQSSIVTPMTLYDDPIVQKTVSRSDFVIRDLVYGEVPMSLYFKVPQPDRDRLRPLVRLMLQLIFNRLMEQLDPDRHHLLLMLDEFPELRKIPNLSAAMSLMAGLQDQAIPDCADAHADHRGVRAERVHHRQLLHQGRLPDRQPPDLQEPLRTERQHDRREGDRQLQRPAHRLLSQAHLPQRGAGSASAHHRR